MAVRYGHTNLIARDWRSLAAFYVDLFGCTLLAPERDFSGAPLERLTSLPGAHLMGAHLRLPGHAETGPTLEIFTYTEFAESLPAAVNRPGFGHIAFEVDDVAAAQAAVLARGGSAVGEIVTLTQSTGAQVVLCYVADPEGNIIELQRWL